jgi:hypothetical protein
MYFEVDQDRVTVSMTLDRKTSACARPKRHDLGLSGIDSDFDVVSVQVNDGAAVGRPIEFDSIVLLHLDRLYIAGDSPVFNAEIKAARLDGGGLGETTAGSPKGYRRRNDSNTYPSRTWVTTAHAPLAFGACREHNIFSQNTTSGRLQ